ncbi:DUF3987 domain-containing protein [Pseudomonas aeruginosa]|uniref:YfjI family protein n=1 Tax=Pseudomonas aeruginosa TaxID=287 RepID=UPI0007A9FE6F|nr:YfjI family protein [Pseudomonas aeruginosa]SAJ33580.1 Uncharacterised protein [Enterobacter cloacae]ELK4790642.1 DUF3987 domain-containing protein [Pseudomonas aeruginosa]MBG6790973.1 DUF3987 domain-containing protein [Pseudomonas aeruginosa]MBG6799224.1 DUF3987 domain-containing protein [Pseudomonas aeruginosa]MCG3012048.1 DUF3987 domain-containing protein [Pseudomonas aeruginosa]
MELFADHDFAGNEGSYSYIDLSWLDAFPVFKEAVLSIAEQTRAPIELVVSVVLAVVALVCQHLIDVRRPWGSTGPVSLIIFVIALSGERKTTVEKIAASILRDFEGRRKSLDIQKIKEWSVLWELWGRQKKKIQKNMLDEDVASISYQQLESALLAHANSEPARPFVFRMFHQDVTDAALSKSLGQDCPSAALFTSEGDIALRRAINQVGMMSALWDGAGVEVGRASTGYYSLMDVRLSIGIGVQPGIFQEYLERKGELGKASGFFARSLIFYPQSTQGTRFLSGEVQVSMDRYTKRMEELLEENVRKFDAKDSSKLIVGFSPEAGNELIRIHNKIESEMRAGGLYERAREYGSKQPENISRVAALLHFFETGGTQVSLPELLSAEKIVMGCSVVYKRLFSFSPQVVTDADALISWLRARCDNSVFKKTRRNDVLQRGPGGLRRASRLNRAVDYLVEKGLVKEVVCGRVAEIELL